MGEFERRRRRLRHVPAAAPQDDPAAPRPGPAELTHPLTGGESTDPVAQTATIADPGNEAPAAAGPPAARPPAAEPERRPGAHLPGPAESDRRPGDGVPGAGAPERPVARPGGGPAARRGAGPRPTSGAGAGGLDDRDAERGLRGLVGSGSSQVSVGAAMRARDAARPTEGDLAEAEERLVIVRRNWLPREDLPRR